MSVGDGLNMQAVDSGDMRWRSTDMDISSSGVVSAAVGSFTGAMQDLFAGTGSWRQTPTDPEDDADDLMPAAHGKLMSAQVTTAAVKSFTNALQLLFGGLGGTKEVLQRQPLERTAEELSLDEMIEMVDGNDFNAWKLQKLEEADQMRKEIESRQRRLERLCLSFKCQEAESQQGGLDRPVPGGSRKGERASEEVAAMGVGWGLAGTQSANDDDEELIDLMLREEVLAPAPSTLSPDLGPDDRPPATHAAAAETSHVLAGHC